MIVIWKTTNTWYLIWFPIQTKSIYSENHNIGVMKKLVVHDVKFLKLFDWTMVSIIAFDWLLKYGRRASSIWVHLACSMDMVFAVMTYSKFP